MDLIVGAMAIQVRIMAEAEVVPDAKEKMQLKVAVQAPMVSFVFGFS